MHIVLFVAAEEKVREEWRRILHDEGYHVVLARDFSQAVKAIRREHPDLVVTDLHIGPAASEADMWMLIEGRHIPTVVYAAAAEEPVGAGSGLVAARVRREEDPRSLVDAMGRVISRREAASPLAGSG